MAKSTKKATKKRGLILILSILTILSVCVIAFAQERTPDAADKLAEVPEHNEIAALVQDTRPVEENPEVVVVGEATDDDLNKMVYFGLLEDLDKYAVESGHSMTAVSFTGTVVRTDGKWSYVEFANCEFNVEGDFALGDTVELYIAW